MKLDSLDAGVLPVAVDRKGSRPDNDEVFSFGKLISAGEKTPSKADSMEESDAETPGTAFHFHSSLKLKFHHKGHDEALSANVEVLQAEVQDEVQDEVQEELAGAAALAAAMQPDAAEAGQSIKVPQTVLKVPSNTEGPASVDAQMQDTPVEVNADGLKAARQLRSGSAVRVEKEGVNASRQPFQPAGEPNTAPQGGDLNVTRFEFGKANSAGSDHAVVRMRLENSARDAIDRTVGRVAEKTARGGVALDQPPTAGQQTASPLNLTGASSNAGAGPVTRPATLDQVPSIIRDMIVKQQSLRNENAQTLSLQLTPRHLGTISVNVTHESGAMKIEIVTGSAAASQAFGSIKHDVAKTFQTLGIAMDDITVRLTEIRQPSNAQQGSQAGSGQQQNGSGQSYSMGGFAGGAAGGGSQSRGGDPGGLFGGSSGSTKNAPLSEIVVPENRPSDSPLAALGKTLYV